MTYAGRETSEQQGQPIEVYEFYYGQLTHRFTSYVREVEFDGNTYEPAPIKRGPIAISIEQPKNSLKLQVPRDFVVADYFRAGPPEESIGLILRRFHKDDSDVALAWSGRVLNAAWAKTSTAELMCEPASISVNRQALGRYFQVQCPYRLFDPDTCKLDKELFRHNTTIDAINGTVITVDSLGSHPYPQGWIEWSDGSSPAFYERRFIISRSGLNLTISRPFSSQVQVNDAISVFPGCDHRLVETCDAIYDNADNNGGFSHMPDINPFDGLTPVY